MSLKLSDEQAKALGIEAYIPPKVTRASNLNELGQNKLEARFARHLDDIKARGGIKAYWFEGVKFRLARKTFYTPDFYVIRADGQHLCYETKGFFREDARIKLKVAAEMYAHINWIVVRWVNREWEYERIEGRG